MLTIKVFPITILVIILGACTSIPSIVESPISENQAIIGLLDEAIQYRKLGQYGKSKFSLERALRLEPRNAHIWFELAKVNKWEDNITAAKNLAQRAKGYSSSQQLNQNIDHFIEGL